MPAMDQDPLPPRPPRIQSMDELINLFAQQRPFAAAGTAHTRRFNHDTFTRNAKEHADRFHYGNIPVRVGRRASPPIAQQPPPIIENVATFDKNTFFQDPFDPKRVFSCCDDNTKSYFQTHGFVELPVTHYTGRPDEVLPSISVPDAPTLTSHDLESAAAPPRLTLPVDYPNLWKPNNGKTTAWCIIHAFEEKVVNPEDKKIYSPYRLWTIDAKRRFRTKANSKSTKYAQAYFIIQERYGHLRAECTVNMKQLVKEAADYNKEHPLPNRPDAWHRRACSKLPAHLAN